jgi:hypothetical protein
MEHRDLLALMEPYRRITSWAVWDVVRPTAAFSRHSRLILPAADPELGSVLRSDVVLLGLNPGNAAHHQTDDYLVFHTGPRHNDHLIAEAFRGTAYWGSYMTDLYTQIESRSAFVRDQPTDIDSVLNQIAILNSGEPVQIITFGGRAFRALEKHSKRLASTGLVRGIARVPHYSGSNNGQHKGDPAIYREVVRQVLTELDSPDAP